MAAIAKEGLEGIILKAMEIPVLPVTAQRVLSLMSDPDVSIEKIKRIISTDAGLATKILKVANSAFYGGYRNIENLSQAILRLGLNSVRNTVIAASIRNVYKNFGLAEKLLWEMTIGSAMASHIISRRTRISDPEDAFIAGLLHDVGKVVLNNEYPQKFAQVMEKVYNEAVPYSAAEKEVFEFSQREVGARIVRKWGFPERIELLLRHFDNYDTILNERWMYELVTVVTTADRICQKFGIGWRRAYNEEVDFGNLPDALGLNSDDFNVVSQEVEKGLKTGIELY
ncbi:MAG: HDOD domain-containing protein [Deltaproteobacteria bacterium]|nr:HDOD domain-containing protein [Deltaproteobacteria bacterium]